MPMRRGLLAVVSVFACLLLPAPPAAAAPSLHETVIKSGLAYPWDIAFTPGGRMLVTKRPGASACTRAATGAAPC